MSRSARISISRIHRPEFSIRSFKPREDIERLASSMAEDGQLSDIRLRTHPEIEGDYELVFGDCRIDGLALLGAGEVDAVVEDLDDERMLFAQWAENECRLPLSEYDRGRWLRNMIERFGYSQKDLAERIGRPGKAGEVWVSRRLAILRLEGIVTRALLNKMSLRQAQAILGLDATDEELRELDREIEHYVKVQGDLPASTYIPVLFRTVKRERLLEAERRPVGEIREELERVAFEPVKDFSDMHDRIEPLRALTNEAASLIRPPLPERTGLSVVKPAMVRRWCREYPDALEDIKRAVKLNLLFYAAYNYVIVPEKAMMLRGLSINDDLLEEVAIGLDGKNPARGSGDWNTLNQWKQLKKMTVPQGEVSEPRERPPPPTREGAPTTLEEESRREEGVDETGPPGPDRTPEEYVTECFLKKEDLNVELLVWEVAVVYGLSEAESRALVEGIQNELRPNGVSAEKARPHVTVCPLCKRHGADTTIIMSQVGDPQLSQMTLEQFVMSTLQEVEE